MGPEPKSEEEYTRLTHQRVRTTGYGIEGVTQHLPCPFCAAGEWMVFRLIDGLPRTPHPCAVCGRTAQIIYHVDNETETRIELVQTAGPDQPEWLRPQMRRVELEETRDDRA